MKEYISCAKMRENGIKYYELAIRELNILKQQIMNKELDEKQNTDANLKLINSVIKEFEKPAYHYHYFNCDKLISFDNEGKLTSEIIKMHYPKTLSISRAINKLKSIKDEEQDLYDFCVSIALTEEQLSQYRKRLAEINKSIEYLEANLTAPFRIVVTELKMFQLVTIPFG